MESLTLKMYPERASVGVEKSIESLRKILSGETPVWEVSAAERREILSIEAELAGRLEPIYLIKTPNVTFDTAYLLTPEGRADFSETTGIDIPEDIMDGSTLETFLYSSSADLATTNNRSLIELGGRTKKFRREEIFKSVSSTIGDTGEIDSSVIPQGIELTIQLKPDLDYEKNEQLRDLKDQIKHEREVLRAREPGDDFFSIFRWCLRTISAKDK